jgi:hypothetical protein
MMHLWALFKELRIIQKLLQFLQYEKPCIQLHDLLYDQLQNSAFSCAQHKAAVCSVIIETAAKPVLNNVCIEKTDSLKTLSLNSKPLSRKILKLEVVLFKNVFC